MTRAYLKGDAFALAVLAVFPLIAYAEPLLEHRLLGPGDGVALHLPMRAEAFAAYRSGHLPFLNTREFLGTPLLPAYRGGVLYPLTWLLSPFETFSAFQALVLISLCLAGVFTYLYLKRLGCGAVGAFVGALSFAYGPYLLSHFEDTATLVASPLLPLVLLTAESHMNRFGVDRLLGLGGAVALLVLAGSPEALKAGGVLLFGRLLLGHTLSRSPRTPPRRATALALLIGLGLSAPQWLPTLELLPSAGRQVTGLAAEAAGETVTGLSGLILRTVTHTPAASLAVASLPLFFEQLPVRVLLLAVGASLALQSGRGPLLAPGALPLVLEFALAALAGLALDEQWRERRTRRGRRLRAYFIVASLASVAGLSLAATALGGLPDRLAAAVGVLAFSLIAYLAFAEAESEIEAGIFLVPLAVSFALQPSSREVFKEAPTRSQLVAGTPGRHAIDLALAELGPSPRVLTLVTEFPEALALDLGFAGYGALAPRVQANGYDPLAPLTVRRTVGEMGARGTLTERSLMPDPDRLRLWAIDAVQVPVSALVRATPGEPLDLRIPAGSRRVVPLPSIRARSFLIAAAALPKSAVLVSVRVNGNREVPLGYATPDAGGFAVTPPAYLVDALVLEVPADAPPLRIDALGIEAPDALRYFSTPLAAYLATPDFQEIVMTPGVRAYRVVKPAGANHSPATVAHTPTPGGQVTLEMPSGEAAVGMPYFPRWLGAEVLPDASGRLLVRSPAGSQVRIFYRPALWGAGASVFAATALLTLLGLRRPRILSRLLKTRRDDGK